MRSPRYTGLFRRDLKLAGRRGKDLKKFQRIAEALLEGSALPPALGDHALRGEWRGHRDLHIEPDWVLIYRVVAEEVVFERTGTHADLFSN